MASASVPRATLLVCFFVNYCSVIADVEINPFTAMMSLENDQRKARNHKPLSLSLFFSHTHVKGFSSKHVRNIESTCVIEQKIYCLQAHLCIFQPGYFTGWGSERVKVPSDENLVLPTVLSFKPGEGQNVAFCKVRSLPERSLFFLSFFNSLSASFPPNPL